MTKTKFNKLDKKIISILDKYDFVNSQNCKILRFSKISTLWFDLSEELSSLFEEEFEQCEKLQVQQIKPVYKNFDIINSNLETLYDAKVTTIDMFSLYSGIYRKSFADEGLRTNIRGFASMYVYLFDNYKMYKQINKKAYYNARIILNGLYGFSASSKYATKQLLFNKANSPVTTRMCKFINIAKQIDNILIVNCDEIVLTSSDISDKLLAEIYDLVDNRFEIKRDVTFSEISNYTQNMLQKTIAFRRRIMHPDKIKTL